jgi:S-adenosylmethionine:tRNA ribosyltransferase-isomerase
VRKALGALLDMLAGENRNELTAMTQMMIIPGYRFRLVNRMITNFHQPRSTLLLLIAAFIGEDWRKVYDYALSNSFRFLSYGDGSLLVPVKT